MKSIALVGLALLVAGCAGGAKNRILFAEIPQLLCKHCNCYMPADVDMAAMCAVCDCGYRYRDCIR